ncbi:cation-translocating P-type ATPase [Nocardia miyunensis]|uniref:cation-translocating P-type ATPase n=1 Tax=Nocardia miyunensis TaxID=282684 RepID=UPI0008362312|nr:cation-translocating P-type ATPase [Nocardia miyunensis]
MIGELLGTASRTVHSGLSLVTGTATLPFRIAEAGGREVRDRLAAVPLAQVRHELMALADPQLHRDRRVAAVGDHVLIEVHGLTSGRSGEVAEAVGQQLDECAGVRDWHINAVTGHVVLDLDEDVDPDDAVTAVADAERGAGVDGLEWDPAATHPADLEPALSAAISLAADLTGVGLAAAGALFPGKHGPLEFLSAAAGVADTQPRIRTLLESRMGRPRTDLLLSAASTIGQVAGEDPGSLLADAVLRTLILAEAGARHVGWRRWESELATQPAQEITEPLLAQARPEELPAGPVEHSADESATGALAGMVTTVAGRGLGDAASALALGAPKAARASRESFAAVAALLMSASGVVTMDPAMWRRLDRLDVLVVDADTLSGERSIVLGARTEDDGWPPERVWSAGQHALFVSQMDMENIAPQDDSTRVELRPVDSPESRQGPAWQEVRVAGRVVGRVLVGRELDPRTPALLAAARRAGLRIVLIGADRDEQVRSLADEFVSDRQSACDVVRRSQRDGHVVAMLATRAHRALATADAGIGLIGADAAGAAHVPWSADVLCHDLDQVHHLLTLVAPARQASERGRVLALSAGALGALVLAARPRRNSQWPVTAAQFGGLFSGAATAWQAGRAEPDATGTVLLPWHAMESDDVLAVLPDPGPSADTGTEVSDSWARQRLAPFVRFGGRVRQELADPLTPILGVGAAASAILGSPADAVLVGSVLAVNATASALQRQRAESSLRRLLRGETVIGRRVPRSALRGDPDADIDEDRVPGDRLRAGDAIVLRAGDVVPADGRIVRADELEMDESALTGESVTVEKFSAATPGAELGERSGMVFEGSTVVNGCALAVVVAAGADTESQRAATSAVPPSLGGVQAQLRQLTERALPLTVAGGSAVTALSWLRSRRLREAIAEGVAVATAAVPEGLPLVATVAQLAAARRLTRRGVLVRASRTVEALGRVDTICFDKTGTLTHGRLELTAVADLTGQWSPDADDPRARRLLREAAHACPDPDGPVVHATDRAVLDAARDNLPGDDSWSAVEEIPFESDRGYAATLGRTAHRMRLVVKGAPEVVLPRCTRRRESDQHGESTAVALSAEDRAHAEQVVDRLARQGLRVLVVARRELHRRPDDVENAVEELTLVGFVGLADTPRPQSHDVVDALHENDIGVRIITGDHPVTAAAIARQLGIDTETVTTGTDLDGLDDDARAELIERTNVFARVGPRQKVQIVTSLQRSGRVVAMAGDGGNDAAAIRSADIGIGLAASGSTAARNAADLVLTDPDPLALLAALTEGRGMWQRITDAVGVLVGGNAGEVAFTVLGTALSGRAPLGTRQFLLVNMLTDMFPAMAVALSPQGGAEATASDDDQLRAQDLATELAARPPADLGADLTRAIATRAAVTTLGATTAWTIGRFTGTNRRASTIGLVSLIGTQLGQTLMAGHRSPLVWATTAASGAVLFTIVMTPGICTYFGCRPLGPVGWTIAGTSSALATGAGVLFRPDRSTL